MLRRLLRVLCRLLLDLTFHPSHLTHDPKLRCTSLGWMPGRGVKERMGQLQLSGHRGRTGMAKANRTNALEILLGFWVGQFFSFISLLPRDSSPGGGLFFVRNKDKVACFWYPKGFLIPHFLSQFNSQLLSLSFSLCISPSPLAPITFKSYVYTFNLF